MRTVILFLAALIVMFCSPSAWGTEVTPARLICDNWPPYQIQDTAGNINGFSIDLIHAVYKRMGLSLDKKPAIYPWNRAIAMLKTGTADALFSANKTPERQRYATYPSEALIESPWIIWTTKYHTITKLQDLKGLKIGVVRGYSYTSHFWNFIKRHCIIETVRNDTINLKKLNAGRVDVLVAEQENGLALKKQLHLTEIKPCQQLIIKYDKLYLIFGKHISSEFIARFSQELKALKATTFYKTLLQKHLVEPN